MIRDKGGHEDPSIQPEEKRQTAELVWKGEDIRATVRHLTEKALQGRDLTLAQIRDVLRTVADGVNMGADLKVGHSTRHYATIVSGVLIGLSEGLQPKPTKLKKRAAAKPAPKAASKNTAMKPTVKKHTPIVKRAAATKRK